MKLVLGLLLAGLVWHTSNVAPIVKTAYQSVVAVRTVLHEAAAQR